MISPQFIRVAKYADLRAALLGCMGAVSLLFPEFLLNGMVYVIAVYAILNGSLGIMDIILSKGREEKIAVYFNAAIAGLAVIFGVLCIAYFRYLVSSLPVFFGTLLIIEGMVYSVTALCVKDMLKPLLVVVSLLIIFGGAALILFAFGFGGLLTLSRIFGILLLFSCISELLIRLIYRGV